MFASQSLDLIAPPGSIWTVVEQSCDPASRCLVVNIGPKDGTTALPCPKCKRQGCPIHDLKEYEYPISKVFELMVIVRARHPYVFCGKCGIQEVTLAKSHNMPASVQKDAESCIGTPSGR